jgi:hypothetical protein
VAFGYQDLVVLLAGRGATLDPQTPEKYLTNVLPSETCRGGLVRELLAVAGQ